MHAMQIQNVSSLIFSATTCVTVGLFLSQSFVLTVFPQNPSQMYVRVRLILISDVRLQLKTSACGDYESNTNSAYSLYIKNYPDALTLLGVTVDIRTSGAED